MNFLRDLVNNKSRLKLVSALLTGFIAAVVIFFVFTFRTRITEFTCRNELRRLDSSARSISAMINEQLYLLESLAREFGVREPETKDEITEAISAVEDIHFFGSLRFADLDGVVHGEDGKVYDANVKGLRQYEEALEGKSSISRELIIDVSDFDKAIILSAPVTVKGEIKGALFGFLNSKGISEMIRTLQLPGENLVILDDGLNIIGKSDGNITANFKNKFDYYLRQFRYRDSHNAAEINNIIEAGDSVYSDVRLNGEDYLLLVTALDVNSWYMVQLMDIKTVNNVRDYLMGFTFMFSLIIFLTGILLFYLTYSSIAVTLELRALNMQYSLLDNENKAVTFSCNPDSRAVELSGAVEQVLGGEIAKTGTVNLVTLLDKLHESDQGLSRDIAKAARDGSGKYETEVRIQNAEGSYDWYKLEAIIVRSRGRVTKIIGSLKNSEAQIAKEHVLKNKAERDLLTGLLNKVTMQNSVEEIIKSRPYSTFAFYIIDMDNFKAVNDNLGHAVGDKVLVDVANKLTLLFNEFDFIGRLGGDEFAVMLVIPENMSNYSSRLIELKAKSLCENLRETYSDETKSVTVSSSIGISIYSADGSNFEELYRHADLALYQSKNTGKNRFTFYSKELEKA